MFNLSLIKGVKSKNKPQKLYLIEKLQQILLTLINKTRNKRKTDICKLFEPKHGHLTQTKDQMMNLTQTNPLKEDPAIGKINPIKKLYI